MTTTMRDLGWSPFFLGQCDPDSLVDFTPYRISAIHRDRVEAINPEGSMTLTTPEPTGDYAVGDWVLADADNRVRQRLDRQTVLQRRAAGTDARSQLIAANVDTLFLVSSCNADFNTPRLERYLALAKTSGAYPVVVLTKADLCDDPEIYRARAEALAPHLTVLCVNALDPTELGGLTSWCGKGQTGALLGSSGVGKSTLLAGLTGQNVETGGIREDDAKGRHTTTSRELFPMLHGGWLIDTPGMRALRLADAADGIEALFSDLSDLARQCRFADCTHENEPGCAIRAAIEAGDTDAGRLNRWRKLLREDARNSETIAEARARDKAFGKKIRRIVKDKNR